MRRNIVWVVWIVAGFLSAGCAEAMRADVEWSIECDGGAGDAGQMEALYQMLGDDLKEGRLGGAVQQRGLTLLQDATRYRSACLGMPHAGPPPVSYADVIKRVRKLTTSTHRAAQETRSEHRELCGYWAFDDTPREASCLALEGKYVTYYEQAAELYAAYLQAVDSVPVSADVSEAHVVAFFYAENLYTQRKWERAISMYEKALEIDPEGKYRDEIFFATVAAYNHIIDRLDPPAWPTLETYRSQPVPEPEAITGHYRQYLDALERYLRTDLDEEKSRRYRLRRAMVQYRFNHLEEALEVFREVALELDACSESSTRAFYVDTLAKLHRTEELSAVVERQAAAAPICAERARNTFIIDCNAGPMRNLRWGY